MWKLTRVVALDKLPATVAAAVARRSSQRGLATSTVALDEEFPGLPALSPVAPGPLKVETSVLPSGVKVVSTEAGKVGGQSKRPALMSPSFLPSIALILPPDPPPRQHTH